ncbi:lipopolysaccharide biosynthesis protein [Enterococcus hirae]
MPQRRIGVCLSYLNVIFKNLSTLLYTPFVIRELGQLEYGLYQMSTSIMTTLFILHLGFSTAYIKFYSEYKKNNNNQRIAELNGIYLTLFGTLGAISVVIGLLFINSLPLIFNKFTYEELFITKRLMFFLIANVSLTFPSVVFDCYIIAKEEFKFQKSREVLLTLVVPLATVPLLLLGYKSVAVVATQVIITGIFLLINIRYACTKLQMKFSLQGIHCSRIMPIFVFSTFIFINQLVDIINWNLPNIVLGMYAGTKDVSIYGVANQIKNVFISISTAISGIYVPLVYQIGFNDPKNSQLSLLMTRIGRYQFLIIGYIFGGFIVFGKYFINIWVGKNYQSAYFLGILLVIPLLIPLIQNIGMEVIRLKNKHKIVSYLYLFFAMINIVFTIFFTQKFGLIGSVLGTFITMLLANGVIINIFYYKIIGLDIKNFWMSIMKTSYSLIIATIAMMFVNYFFPIKHFLIFIIYGLIYSSIFMLATYQYSLSIIEKQKLNIFIKKIYHKTRGAS